MSRRGENIYRRKDGRWEARIPNGFTDDGRKKYRSVYARSYTEVKEKAKQQKAAVPEKPTGRMNMEAAIRLWLRDKQFQWKESTYSCYTQIAEKQLIPAFGKLPVNQMNNSVLNDFIAEKRNGSMPLSDSYIRDMTRMLTQVMKHLRDEYHYEISTNISALKPRAKEEKRLPDQKTIEKLERYLMAHVEDRTCIGILLCCHTGLRIGELCALCWEDIDLDAGILHVRRTIQRMKRYQDGGSSSQVVFSTPKSKRSSRDIPLTPVMLKLLREAKGSPKDFLIPGKNVPYAEPRTLQYRFRSILSQCGIEYFNFHMLRHIFATRCIVLGFDTNSVSELLGHANVQITLNLYVHSSAERKRELMSHYYISQSYLA